MSYLFNGKVLLVLLLLLCAGAATWYVRRAEGHSGQGSAWRTAEAQRGDLTVTITATGTIEPEESIDVGAQVQGRITEFGKDVKGKSVDNNSEVKAGQVLAVIDASVYQSEVDQAQAQLKQAQAGVARAQADLGQLKAKLLQADRDWKRAQKLGPSDALSQADYDAYDSAYETAKANVAVGESAIEQAKATVTQNEAALKRAQQNLNYCTIYAPVDGVVITRRVNIGQTVVSSLSAPSLFLLAKDLTRMVIWASVNEADIGKIKVDQPVIFTVDAYPERKFRGTVSKVRIDAQMTQNVVTYTVEIAADNPDRALVPYMTANVSFEVSKRENALLVPNGALRWSPTDPEQVAPDARSEFASGDTGGGRPRPTSNPSAAAMSGATSRPSRRGDGSGGSRGMVWIADGNYVRPVRVRLGVTDTVNTEVIGGDLKEGDPIVLGDASANAPAVGEDAKNPFAPQFRGGRGGGGGGGGRGR